MSLCVQDPPRPGRAALLALALLGLFLSPAHSQTDGAMHTPLTDRPLPPARESLASPAARPSATSAKTKPDAKAKTKKSAKKKGVKAKSKGKAPKGAKRKSRKK